jgi:hypothetical protein
MSFFAFSDNRIVIPNRRAFLGSALLSGAAVALLAGRDALAAGEAHGANFEANDANILNTALGAELEAVAAYQVAAESGLLEKPVLVLATQFQGHHRDHADLLAKTVSKLGGKPVAARRVIRFRPRSSRHRPMSCALPRSSKRAR